MPADRLLLGLPLYGVDWPVAGPVIGAPSTRVAARQWFPRAHVDLLTDPTIVPERDEVEQVDVYFSASDGTVGRPAAARVALARTRATSDRERTWTRSTSTRPGRSPRSSPSRTSGDSPGAGFWAIGYTRGLPAYTELMKPVT